MSAFSTRLCTLKAETTFVRASTISPATVQQWYKVGTQNIVFYYYTYFDMLSFCFEFIF